MPKTTIVPHPKDFSSSGWQIELRHIQVFNVVIPMPTTREAALDMAIEAFKSAIEARMEVAIYGAPTQDYAEAVAEHLPADPEVDEQTETFIVEDEPDIDGKIARDEEAENLRIDFEEEDRAARNPDTGQYVEIADLRDEEHRVWPRSFDGC